MTYEEYIEKFKNYEDQIKDLINQQKNLSKIMIKFLIKYLRKNAKMIKNGLLNILIIS